MYGNNKKEQTAKQTTEPQSRCRKGHVLVVLGMLADGTFRVVSKSRHKPEEGEYYRQINFPAGSSDQFMENLASALSEISKEHRGRKTKPR